MKKLIAVLSGAAIATLAGCSSPQQNNNKDTVVAGNTLAKAANTPTTNNTNTLSSLCFLHTEGKDSSQVELVIKGNQVTGVMNWLPYQKDARKGKLTGKMSGDTVRAEWSFMQEGVTDTLGLNFLLKDNKLSQKPLKLNKKTGREQTDESAGYDVKYKASGSLKK